MKNSSLDYSNDVHICELSTEAQELVTKIRMAVDYGQQVVLLCKPSIESILVTTALTYYANVKSNCLRLCLEDRCQPQLDEVLLGPLDGLQDLGLVQRLLVQLQRNYDKPARYFVAYACSYDDPSMPQAVYEWIRMVLQCKKQSRSMLAAPQSEAFLNFVRKGRNECEHARQFIRMSKMEDGSYFARFSCKANVLPLVASYFAGRLRTENFAIVDPKHSVVISHIAGDTRCSITLLDKALLQELLQAKHLSDEERYIRDMWKMFYKKIGFSGRNQLERGYDLRTSWVPKRFWSNLHELEP
ncbi:TIGR03915 family putative DNA repair protein [Atopobium fossor]|uniref:TIGR03915 family putative DNA repair protein n=1 Tax=Atopobium fossor TaxID=39487 RepID=UPI00040D2129|nr:TIGR03915 family putative DNA repair protein [Atopobium fossor]